VIVAFAMRVLFIHSPADLYGASRSLLRLCTDLRRDDVAVAVVLPAEGALALRLREIGVEIFIRPGIAKLERQNLATAGAALRFSRDMIVDIVSQFRLIGTWRPDVVHTNISITPASAIAAMLRRRPHLWHLRENFGDFPALWRFYRHFMGAFATRLVCNSHLTARQFAGVRGETRTRVVYNGLSAAEFGDFSPSAVAAWRQLLSRRGGPVIGVVGRIKLVRKGQEVFLQAASRLAAKFPDACFVCIGGAYPGNEDHVEELLKRAEVLGIGDRFVITGDIEDVGPATAALDVAIMPSVAPEPFGNVVMEAMCLGKPIVASANGGAAEQILDGVTGILVPPGDAEALATAIGGLLDDPEGAKRMGEAGRLRFAELFSSDRTYAAIQQIYDEVLPAWREEASAPE
jgi:glycosyltransferase involved in cell wall biosynthesis